MGLVHEYSGTPLHVSFLSPYLLIRFFHFSSFQKSNLYLTSVAAILSVGIYAIGRFSIVILPLMAIISARGIVTSRFGARFLSLVE